MKILMARTLSESKLLDPPLLTPLGIYTLASIIKKNGHDVTVADPHKVRYSYADEKSLEQMVGNVDCVGFSANSFNWPTTRTTISQIKKIYPKMKIVVGGIHASYFPEHALQVSEADAVLQGEGEDRFPLLIEALEGKREIASIPGITYRKNGDIKSTPPTTLLDISTRGPEVPLYEALPEGIYDGLCVESSRGCYANCCFCSIAYRSRWRAYNIEKTVESVKASIKYLHKTKNQFLYFVDDCFTGNSSRATKVVQQMEQTGQMKCKIGIEARINSLLKRDLLEELSKLNVSFIQTGIECGYEEGLKLTRKGTTLVKVREAAKLLKEYGLNSAVRWSFIIGLPWETKKECLQTIHFAAELTQEFGGRANVTWFVLIPSWLWNNRQKFGIAKDISFFDEDSWFIRWDNFFDTHPRISKKDFEEIESTIQTYIGLGVSIRDFKDFELVFK